MTTLITIIAYLAAAVALWATICTINFMSRSTPFITRVAYILVGIGAGSVLLTVVYSQQPPGIPSAIFSIGVAIMLIAGRLHARRVLQKHPDPDGRFDHLCGPWWS